MTFSRILNCLWAGLLALACAPAAFPQSQSGFTYNGLNLTSYQATEYQNSSSAASSMRATGANYTAVMETQYQQTYTSNSIAPETTSSPGYNSSSYPLTPTDASVVAAIQNLQSQGLTVSLKPQVDSLDGVFRANFAPTNPAAWFASYQTFILHYAQIASQNHVGLLVIGTELKSLTTSTYKSYWETIISAIRAQYPGLTLAYGANATGPGDEFTSVSFWSDVDIIGVDGYFPLTNQNDPSLSALVAAWSNNKSGFNIVAALKNLQSTYNKPLIFTELGYVSVSGTNQQPYASLSGSYDPTEQQDCYEAFFEVFSQQTAWMKGIFWWDWTVSAPAAGDTGYSPQGKPAGTVTLPKWFNNSTPGFTIAPAQSTVALGQGLTTTDVISITDQGGFTGTVTLTATGLPNGVTGNFSAGAVAGTQVLTLSASSAAALAGPVSVTVTGTSGNAVATANIALSVVTPASQTIAFANPGPQKIGATFALAATASSGLPVTYSTTTPTVCSVSNSAATATMLTAGTCTLTASQSGNATYAAAASITDSFAVAAIPPVAVPANDQVIVSQVNYLANVGGYALSAGNPAGGSIGVNSKGMVVVANNVNIQLVNATTGALLTLGAWGNSAAAVVDQNDNIYLGNSYGPVNSIVKLPYVGAATNGGYSPFTTPTTSTPACTSASTTECLLPANLGSINVASMAFDAAGDLFFVTAGSGNTSGNGIYECNTACLSGTGAPVNVYTETTATTTPSSTSGQLLIGSVAVDTAGDLFFTDSSIYTNLSTYAYSSFSSNVKELTPSTGAGYGGVPTGFAAAPTTLYTLNTPNPSTYGNQLNGAVVLRSSSGDTVYFADQFDQIFGFPDTSGGIPVASGKPTALFTVANQGAIDLTIDKAGNLYPLTYSTATGSGGDTVAQVTTDAVTVPTSATGAVTGPSSTTSPVTTILNDASCSGSPAPSVTFAATAGSNATASLTPASSCTSTYNGNASFATTVSFTPTVAGPDVVTLTGQDQSTNSATVTVSGTGSGFTIAPVSTSMTVPQTTSVTDTLTIADFGGFTGNVTLAASGLPTGVTASFATNPATSSSVLTLSASSAAAIGGPYNVILTGTSGTQTAIATLAVSVTAAPGFTLSGSSPTLTIAQNNSATDTITVNQLSGFSGAVTLSASGLPAGVTAAFATNPTSSTSVLTLTASSTATVSGPVSVTITGTSGSTTQTTTLSLTVTSAPSYQVGLASNTASVTQGSTATDGVTVTALNGFSGSVTFSASGLPTGVTAAFSPNPTSTGSSTLTLTAASNAPFGSPATVTVTGTSGSATQTATLTLTVNAAPGFTLAAAPTTVSVPQSGSGSDTVTITDQGGFTGAVTLTASGLPSGVTAAFAANPATGSSAVTFTATAAAATGTSTVTITGTSGSVTSSTTVGLTVTPPPSFTLSAAPATLNVVQGSTASSTVTVMGANSFNGSVTLGVTSLPTGVIASFGTNPTTGTSTVTFTAAAGAPAGTSTVTITGTSGTLTASTTVALTTVLAPTFVITPASTTLTVVQGGATVSDALTITSSNGFSSAVTLTASGLPSGVTATFTTNPAGATSTVQFTAASTTTVGGPATVTITGTSGSIKVSTAIALTISPPPSFTLAATPATITLPQTTSATSTIAVTQIGGFSSTPALTVTGLPVGVTATITGTSATAQTLTLTASATAGIPAGSTNTTLPVTATITIKGTSGALSATTTVTVMIVSAPSFTVTGPGIVVKAGAGVLNSTPLSIVATNGFTGTVALACSITPVASTNPPTCTLSPSTVTLAGTTPQTTTLTVNTVANVLVENKPFGSPFARDGSVGFAVLLLFGVPRRRRKWAAGLLLLVLGTAATGLSGCSSSPNYSTASSGTAVGAYTVTISGTSGSTTASGTVTLTVQ